MKVCCFVQVIVVVFVRSACKRVGGRKKIVVVVAVSVPWDMDRINVSLQIPRSSGEPSIIANAQMNLVIHETHRVLPSAPSSQKYTTQPTNPVVALQFDALL